MPHWGEFPQNFEERLAVRLWNMPEIEILECLLRVHRAEASRRTAFSLTGIFSLSGEPSHSSV